jgi:hypothetical protein
MSDIAVREFGDAETLGAARGWMREQARQPGGACCPVCRRPGRIDRRGVERVVTRSLLAAWRQFGRGDFRVAELRDVSPLAGRKFSQLRYWGLVEDATGDRPRPRSYRWWRITDLGEAWLRGKVGVPRFAYFYNREMLGYDTAGEQEWTVRDVLGEEYTQLWEETPAPPI